MSVCLCVSVVYKALYDCLFVFLVVTTADLKVNVSCILDFSKQVWSVFYVEVGLHRQRVYVSVGFWK